MGEEEVEGTVTSLSSLFPAEEALKAAKRVEEALSEKQNEMNQLRGFIADNTSLTNLVQKLPDELHHDIMVPFGKAAFFPGRLIHTNEFLVLLGESYYAERTAKQTADILKRRGKSLESKVDALKAVMQDLKAEASFFDSTASEVAEGLVEIREEYVEENCTQPGQMEQESPSFAESDNKIGASEDDEFARIMSRLEELEIEELAAKNREENGDDQAGNDAGSDGNEDEQTNSVFHRIKDEGYTSRDNDQTYSESEHPKGKDLINEEIFNKYHHQDLTNQLAHTRLTGKRVSEGEMSHGLTIASDTKMLNPSISASVPLEKESVQSSKSEFDTSKAFTGSIVEHAQNLEKDLPGQITISSQVSGSKPSKPVSRFKMQRK